MGLVGSGDHPPRKSRGGGEDKIVARDIELLDEERAQGEKIAVVVSHARKAVQGRRAKGISREVKRLYLRVEEVEKREDVGIRKEPAEPCEHALPATKVRAPVVNNRDPRAEHRRRRHRLAFRGNGARRLLKHLAPLLPRDPAGGKPLTVGGRPLPVKPAGRRSSPSMRRQNVHRGRTLTPSGQALQPLGERPPAAGQTNLSCHEAPWRRR